MGILRYLEYYLARLLYNSKGRDAKLLTHGALFQNMPQNIHVESPELGPSGSHLDRVKHTQYGANKFPELKWTLDASHTDAQADVKEYLLLVEDPDAPIPIVPNHGLYYAIPPTTTHLRSEDVTLQKEEGGAKWLKGGFRLGRNLRGTVYSGPRPPVGHGEHRYFFQVVALKETLDTATLSPVATKAELVQAIEGKILGYGIWIGVFEEKWK